MDQKDLDNLLGKTLLEIRRDTISLVIITAENYSLRVKLRSEVPPVEPRRTHNWQLLNVVITQVDVTDVVDFSGSAESRVITILLELNRGATGPAILRWRILLDSTRLVDQLITAVL